MDDDDFLLEESAGNELAKFTGTDPRILNISYSSILTLHTCPRKFQLNKLQSRREEVEDIPGSVTFAYGHVVGSGIQAILENKPMNQVIWEAFLEWDVDLLADNTKQNKSFFGALHALNQFKAMRDQGYLDGYELVTYQGKPACELSFVIHMPNGFKYRGFVDAVLRHTITGEVMVLECKTTNSASVNPAQYKNSAQAIGYSIVLDALFPELSSYKVLYLVYQTKSEEYVQIPFDKSYYARALWIKELLLDIEMIMLYEEQGIYPMHGESCFSYYRECEYMQLCTLSTEHLATPLTQTGYEKLKQELADFQIQVTIEDLIKAQIAKDIRTTTPMAVEGELL